MKNLIVLVCLAFTLPLMAQNTDDNKKDKDATASLEHSLEDYEKYFQAATKMKFREYVIGSLNLNESEIIAFDPIFRDYFRDKNEIVQNRINLVNDYKTEMKKDESVESNNEESYNFIQNYWDIKTDNTELQQNYFEKFKNELGWQKAFKFFILEEASQNRVILNKDYEIFPEIEKIYYYPLNDNNPNNDWKQKDDTSSASAYKSMKDRYNYANNYTNKDNTYWTDSSKYQKGNAFGETMKDKASDYSSNNWVNNNSPRIPVQSFSHWVENPKDSVSLSHSYTYNGIIVLANAIESVAMNKNIDFDKEAIIQKAYKLTLDPMSTDHADYTSEIFTDLASTYGKLSNNQEINNKLTTAASKIDPDKLLTRQAQHIKNFFKAANEAMMALGYTDSQLKQNVSLD